MAAEENRFSSIAVLFIKQSVRFAHISSLRSANN